MSSSTTVVSKAIKDAVWLILPEDGDGLTPSETHKRLDMWAPRTVNTALIQLAEEGRVVFIGPDGHRKYRRAVAE